MVAHIQTVAFRGIEALPVEVQVITLPGKVGMNIVGLADKAIAESKERLQAAMHAMHLSVPVKKVTINLAPADLPKEGAHYDLPIIIGLLIAMEVLPQDIAERFVVLGELSLDGSLLPVQGVIPATLYAKSCQKGVICPHSCGPEAAWVDKNMEIIAPRNLIELIAHFSGTAFIPEPESAQFKAAPALPDLSDIKGQEVAKRALEVAASGGHNILFVGPPGSGKSMLAQRLPSLLPPLDTRELLEVSLIASISGESSPGVIATQRPFRSPHHSASMAALIGGGMKAKPGEISLAHNGVLFLDEFPEFSPKVLDSLRQPLENGECIVARANYHIRYPARVQLVAAMNPCRCGLAGERGHVCARGERCQTDYQARISGPLLDRIDLRVCVPAVSAFDMMQTQPSEKSKVVAKRVLQARAIQKKRYEALGIDMIRVNGECPAAFIDEVMQIDEASIKLLQTMSEKMRLSARSYHRLLKLARTIADMEASEKIKKAHLAEAISYRMNFEDLSRKM